MPVPDNIFFEYFDNLIKDTDIITISLKLNITSNQLIKLTVEFLEKHKSGLKTLYPGRNKSALIIDLNRLIIAADGFGDREKYINLDTFVKVIICASYQNNPRGNTKFTRDIKRYRIDEYFRKTIENMIDTQF